MVLSRNVVCGLMADWYERMGEDGSAQEWERWPQGKCISEDVLNEGWKAVDDWNGYSQLSAYADTVRLCLARNRYKAGTSTMGNLLEAQLLSQQSKDKLTDAYADLKMRQLDYRQATGPSRTF